MSEKDETNEPEHAESPAAGEQHGPEAGSGSEYQAGPDEPAGEDAAAPDAGVGPGDEPDSTAEPGPEGDANGGGGSDATAQKDDAAESVPSTPEEETEEQYEALPGGGHRVTRRTVHRTRLIEDVEETVTEYLPPSAYVAPATPGHPAPVG